LEKAEKEPRSSVAMATISEENAIKICLERVPLQRNCVQ
jgi:hypothetical protein